MKLIENFKNLFILKSVKLFEKYKNTKNYLILFCILQYYLIENKLRNIAQIEFRESSKYQITKMYTFLNENYIPFVDSNNAGIIISNDKKKLDEIDKYIQNKNYNYIGLSKKLGPFYKCSSNTYLENHYRIVILAIINNFSFEIYAQMCKKETLEKNLKGIYKIYDEVSNLFEKLDKNIYVKMETYKT